MSDIRFPAITLVCFILAGCAKVASVPVESTEADPPVAVAPQAEVTPRAPAAAVAVPRVAEDVDVHVVKSPNDTRRYRFLTLDNGLEVLLVSDPGTDKAAAALTVFRGSYHDPDAYPGLAHFLEHMLFIGTAKYPEVDGYQEFISRHGGASNAYTAGDHTNYFFDIQPAQFEAAMDRFAQFFISPLFEAEYVDREKNAVNSEYQLQVKADSWRGAAAVSQALNPAHPESRFNIGSLGTLGAGVRDALINFFEENYSADQMALVALSNESLAELERWISPMFEAIENRELGPDPIEEPLFLPGQLPAQVDYQTIKDGYQVVYNFPVPAIEQYYKQKPAEYVSNLLGHEGQGSLYQQLQRAGWIESLSVGTGSFDSRNSLLLVEMALTDRGYTELPQVTAALFDYIELLRDNAPEAWRYEEQARMAELGFRFQEQSSATGFVYQVAPRFLRYPPEDVLAAPYLMETFDPALIESYVNALTLDNLLVEVAGPDVPTTDRERWFDVPYQVVRQATPIADVEIAGLALPPPNPYLPENLTVLPDEPEPPQLAVARPGLTVWTDRDTEFKTPRANLYLSLAVPDGIATPEDLALASLYTRVVEDALSEAVYPAYLAGLGYRLDVDGYGLEVTISGYSDKQLTLLDTVLAAVRDTTIDPERFAVLRNELLRDWRNYRDERPYTQAFGALGYLLLSSQWPPEMLIAVLETQTPESLAEWRDTHTDRFHVSSLVHGNVPVEGGWALASLLQDNLHLGAFSRSAPTVVQMNGARRYDIDIDHQDAAMVLYLQDPKSGPESRAMSGLAASVLSQAYFTSLRTEQQLGYVVAATNQTVRDRGGLAFIVQSPVASVADLEHATVEFLRQQVDTVRAMPDEAFTSYRQGLISRLLEKDKNVVERGSRLWADLELGYTNFDSRRQIAADVAAIDQAQLVEYLAATAGRFEQDRLLVYSDGQFEEAPPVGRMLDDVRAFKNETHRDGG